MFADSVDPAASMLSSAVVVLDHRADAFRSTFLLKLRHELFFVKSIGT